MKVCCMRTEWISVLATLIIFTLLLVGCTSATASHSPVINSVMADRDVLLASQTCEISCNASHLDGQILTYQWSANGGSISGEGPVVHWTAPDVANTYYITVSVSNGNSGQSVSYLSIEVVSNKPPTIASLDIEEDEVIVSADCHLTCVAADQDGGELSYKWSSSGGNISGEGPVVDWTAPEEVGTYTITVTVSDGQGGQATKSLDIDVLANNNRPKVKGFRITDITGEPVEEKGIRITKHYFIECRASDPDGDELSYDWWVSEGAILDEDDAIDILKEYEEYYTVLSHYIPKLREGIMVLWKAPDEKPGHDGEVIFEVTVRDKRGGKDDDGMSVMVYLSKCDSVL